jgi:hypothetical protein
MEPAREVIDDQLDTLLAAGRQMLAEARDGEWDRVAEFQAQCYRLAEKLFAKPVAAADAAAVTAAVSEVMELHREVTVLCKDTHDATMQGLGSLNVGRRAVSKYTANSG